MIFDLFGTLFSILLFIVAIIIVRLGKREYTWKELHLIMKIIYVGGAIFGIFLLIYQIIYKTTL